LGEKKIELIMNEYPDILISKETNTQKTQKIQEVKGIAEKSAASFVENIETFNNFIKECGLEYKLNQSFVKPNIININTKVGLLTDKTIVMTGFRDKNLEEKIKSAGGKIGAGVSKNTFVVIVKHLDEDTSKVSDAKKNGIKLITVDEFNNKYLINNK